MLSSLIIMFREALEAALVIGIILGYLNKTNQKKLSYIVYIALGCGLVASIIGAVLFNIFAGGFEGKAEEIYEGIVMLLGATLLTTLILWMIKNSNVKADVENKLDSSIKSYGKIGLFLIVFTSILREGIETVIFLQASNISSKDNNLIGATIGLVLAIVFGFLLFKGFVKLSLKHFFTVTNILLILFAAGLVAHGVHELEEAKILNPIVEHVWNINPVVNPDGTLPLLHEKGYIGSILVGLFGYNGNPSLFEVICYIIYIISVFGIWIFYKRKK